VYGNPKAVGKTLPVSCRHLFKVRKRGRRIVGIKKGTRDRVHPQPLSNIGKV
jgi:hypothetical protein